MALAFAPISISTRRKLASILLAVTIFATLSGLSTLAKGRPLAFGLSNAIIVGTGVGLFEQFYVQSLRGRWFRSIHPLLSIALYTAVVAVLFLFAVNLTHFLLFRFYSSPVAYSRLPFVLPNVILYAVVGIVVMRAVHFIGIDTLFHLMIGTYHRPVVEQKVLVFVDINNSTGLAEKLGALKIKSLVGKFLFDISRPITDHGGEIYLYKGDGLIAIWDWREAVRDNTILRVIDAMFAAVRREHGRYMTQFGVAPTFRVGVHGGDVVVSEQGDTKRSIGIYGSTINIASRMEEAAKAHGVACAISGEVADALSDPPARLHPLGYDRIVGISAEIPIFEYRDGGEAASRPIGKRWKAGAAEAGWRVAARLKAPFARLKVPSEKSN
jgi:adenylate cyclase